MSTTNVDLREVIGEFIEAIDAIVAAWESGDLAGAVNDAEALADQYHHLRFGEHNRVAVSGTD